jgi:serine/threonine protein kinase
MSDTNEGLSINEILLERYKIIELINTSPGSKLYKAYDSKYNRSVFIKEMISNFKDRTLKQQAIEQFKCEAKILFKLKHDNLPKFEDYFDHDSNRYLVLNYIECKRLNVIVENHPGFLPQKQVISWAVQLCDVLSYLHSNKPEPIIFRNLSPQSVFMAKDGKLKLVDFGISKIFSSEDMKTMGLTKIMNPHYSPIEQHGGTTDNRSDIYSLGATMYYLLTKEPPMDSVERVVDEDDPMPTCNKFNKNISSSLVKIISKAMELDKKVRYQIVEELKSELLNLPAVDEKRIGKRFSNLRPARLKEYIKPITMATGKIKGGLGYRKPLPRENVTVSNLPSEQSSRISSQPVNQLKENVTVSNLPSEQSSRISSQKKDNILHTEQISQLDIKVTENSSIAEYKEEKETQQKLTCFAAIFAWLENLFTGLAIICTRLKN